MTEFSPEDGVIYFAWRNTFDRVSRRTYQFTYCRSEVVEDDGSHLIQEIPYQDGRNPIDWVRLLHERTFDREERVKRYVNAMLSKYAKEFGGSIAPLRVIVAESRAPQASTMYYDNGTLVLPAPSPTDRHEDVGEDPLVRERFMASRWTEVQRQWPIIEHHILHELAHHITRTDRHDGNFAQAFRNLLGLASAKRSQTDQIWDWEMLFATRLIDTEWGVVDMVTNKAYNVFGEITDDKLYATA